MKTLDNKNKFEPLKQLSNNTWSHIWLEWLKAEKKHKSDVTFSLWLQDNYNVPTKK